MRTSRAERLRYRLAARGSIKGVAGKRIRVTVGIERIVVKGVLVFFSCFNAVLFRGAVFFGSVHSVARIRYRGGRGVFYRGVSGTGGKVPFFPEKKGKKKNG